MTDTAGRSNEKAGFLLYSETEMLFFHDATTDLKLVSTIQNQTFKWTI